MAKSVQHPPAEEVKAEVADARLLDQHKLLLSRWNHEADGIWARFNILFAANATLLGAFIYYLLNPKNENQFLATEIRLMIPLLGFAFALFGAFIFKDSCNAPVPKSPYQTNCCFVSLQLVAPCSSEIAILLMPSGLGST